MVEVSLGATYLRDGRCRFLVWAPLADQVEVHITAPREIKQKLSKKKNGYFQGIVGGVKPGSLYYYVLDGRKKRPDPASRYQPEGVHGPSQVINNNNFSWSDNCWFGTAGDELILYELHVGTFTQHGTFEAVIPNLEDLGDLGITAIEIMPVAQFPGSRNWGYDGVFPFAVQNSYGVPEGLQKLVDACHQKGLSVILDVVYNHLGPEGNYLPDFAPYFTDRYAGPWGASINFDGPQSDEVRRYFIENALYWLTEYHIDGFRLDAIHAIKDFSAQPFLEELATAVHRQGERLGRRVHIIAESDLNDDRVINPPIMGGYGMDAQWADDFHHSLHTLLTGEQNGYYQDYGNLSHLGTAFSTGYVYTGQYSKYRRRRHGNFPQFSRGRQFVVFSQNHDQVGNRAFGERLTALTSFSGLKVAACAILLSPFIPLIFMGEEYGEIAPFQYFTSHNSRELVEAVRQGRRKEFAAFAWDKEVPDPQEKETFLRSRLNHDLKGQGQHRILKELYKELILLRRQFPALAELNKNNLEVVSWEEEKLIFIRRWHNNDEVCIVFSFNEEDVTVTIPIPAGNWQKRLDTADKKWMGNGNKGPLLFSSPGKVEITLPARSCVLFQQAKED